MNNTEAERQLERKIRALQQQLSDLRITSDMEQEKVLLREFEDRFAAIKLPESEEDTIREIEDDLEKHITERNEASLKEKGHPEYVFKKMDGDRLFKRYDDLTSDELTEAKTQGFG